MIKNFESKTTWPENCDGLGEMKMNEILKKLKKDDERGRAEQFLSALTEHVLCQANNAVLLESANGDDSGHNSEDEVGVIEFGNEGEEEGDRFFDDDNDTVDLIEDSGHISIRPEVCACDKFREGILKKL
jgi:hypothetical protein